MPVTSATARASSSARGCRLRPEHGEHQPLFGDAQVAGQQVPGEVDGVGLEVVAVLKLPSIPEEKVMAGGIADVVEIVVLATSAHALWEVAARR